MSGFPYHLETLRCNNEISVQQIFINKQIDKIDIDAQIAKNEEKYREKISDLYRNISDGVDAEVQFIEDGYVAEEELSNADFGSGVPLILGSTWERDVADEIGALLVEVGTITTEEVVLNRSYIGYRGALSLIEQIYSAAVGANP